jgi:hypothetical protein
MGDSGGSVVSVDVERISFGGKVRRTTAYLFLLSDSLFLGCFSALMGILFVFSCSCWRWVSGCEKMPAWWYLLVVWGRGGTRPLNFVAPGRNRISWVALRLRFYCGIWSV